MLFYGICIPTKENLTFVLRVSKLLNLKNDLLLKTLKNFKGLSFRQEIIHNSKFLKVINDSKATSFSSSEKLLKSLKNIYWIIGGLPKKGDKFLLKKNDCKKIKLYIFGKKKGSTPCFMSDILPAQQKKLEI